MAIGEAFIDVHANTSPFNRELDRDLGRAASDAEGGLKRTGRSFGDKVSDAMSLELGKRGKQYAKAIENAIKRTVVKVTSKIDTSNMFKRDRSGQNLGKKLVDEVEDAFDKASRRGGPFNKIGMAMADAIGAGFNVSGRSPLIALLIPALLAILGLIVAAIQAANSLVAVLVTLPALLTAIGLQIGVVVLAFQGVGSAIEGAFKAKNVTELNEALKGLTPSAREFVKSLLPLRDLFRDLQRVVQENFFRALGNSVGRVISALGPVLRTGFPQLATAMGTLFAQLASFFSSRAFVSFVRDVFPATARWLRDFGPALLTFITGLLDMANTALPFLEQFGKILNNTLLIIGQNFSAFADDPEFRVWLQDMAETFGTFVDVIGEAFFFLVAFLSELNKAGGRQVVAELSNALEKLSFFLSSPVGKKAMENLVNLAIIGIQSFVGLLIAVLAVMAGIEVLGEGLRALWNWFTDTALPAVVNFFTIIGVALEAAVNWIRRTFGGLFSWIGRTSVESWSNVTRSIAGFFVGIVKAALNFLAWIRNLPKWLLSAIGNLGGLLVRQGQLIIEGLVNGIKSRLNWLRDWIRYAASIIGNFFGNSPAKEGPLSGQGYTLLRGQRLMRDFVKGIESEIPALRTTTNNATSNIVFGTNSIHVTIHGPTPDQNQARTVGSTIGRSAADMIATRNTRLAVRTL